MADTDTMRTESVQTTSQPGAGNNRHSLHRLVGRLLCVQCGQIRDEDDQDGAICNHCDSANQEDYDDESLQR